MQLSEYLGTWYVSRPERSKYFAFLTHDLQSFLNEEVTGSVGFGDYMELM
jgi:hypothetical protein